MAAIDDRIAEHERRQPRRRTPEENLELFERTGDRWYLTMARMTRSLDLFAETLRAEQPAARTFTLIEGGRDA